MLCFVQGFDGNKDEVVCNNKQQKEHKLQTVKNKILRKSRSSGNFSNISGTARSAPTTPNFLLASPSSSSSSTTISQFIPSSNITTITETTTTQSLVVGGGGGFLGGGGGGGGGSPQIQRSPSHSAFNKCDKASLKHLSTSTPIMTAQAQLTEPPTPKTTKAKVHTISKTRQKKFVRHFPQVDEDEKVLNHYSCALIGDILLQGHLYITNNYFAFYSNVFGYVTKVLIPILTVEKITKEKTARIIPNAVGIVTSDDKHVFGSLMSRDSTLQFMTKIWEKAKSESPVEPDVIEPAEDSTESVEEGSGRESPQPETIENQTTTARVKDKPTIQEIDHGANINNNHFERKTSHKGIIKTVKTTIEEFQKLPRQNFILVATTLLLILLFLSAAILLYRISKIQNRYTMMTFQDNFGLNSNSEDVYNDLLQWQTHLHSKSAGAVSNFLDTNLDQIAKVRQSLEALSSLLIQNNNNKENSKS